MAKTLDDIYNLIAQYNKNITEGPTKVPYKELPFTLLPSQRLDVFEVFSYFRVLSLTTTSDNQLSVQFGDNGAETFITGQGIGLHFNNVFSRFTLINNNNASELTVTVAIADGNIDDSRLSVNSVIASKAAPDTLAFISADVQTVSNAAGGGLIIAANTIRMRVTIKNPSTNTEEKYIAGASSELSFGTGFKLDIGESITFVCNNEVWAKSPTLATENVYILFEFS